MPTPSNLIWDEPSEPEISISAVTRAQLEDGERDVVGERFGKYLLVGELAVGGMAEVFLAVQQGLEGFQKVVVIKRVLPHFSSNAEFTRMFVDEARLAARLEHSNLVRTYEFGAVEGQYFTAMEYLPGEDLTKMLNRLAISRQQLPFNLAAGIVSSVLHGLQFAHELTDTAGRPLGLVHRDVTPANIILTYTGEVKLIDFGVAKTRTNAQTINGTIKGKIAYMAPEQLLSRGVDQRSDVFSTGVVLWEVLTGRPLFRRDCEAATLYAILNDPIPPPSRVRPGVPKQLDEIVECALARSPADRFQSAEEMSAALDEFLATQPTYDPRSLARTLEELFGSTRAEAKRSIAQTRSLAHNVSLVMKVRSEVRADLDERLDAVASLIERSDPVQYTNVAAVESVERTSRRGLVVALALIMLACIGGGLYYYQTQQGERPAIAPSAVASATLEITSTPPGAAVFVGGEPTGLKTPATLTDLTAAKVTIRLELAEHGTVTETIEVAASGATSKHFALASSTGRLVISGLPAGATIFVDGHEHAAGEVIPVATGTRELRLELEGETIARQSIEATTGDQVWTLAGNKLVPNAIPKP